MAAFLDGRDHESIHDMMPELYGEREGCPKAVKQAINSVVPNTAIVEKCVVMSRAYVTGNVEEGQWLMTRLTTWISSAPRPKSDVT